MTSRRARRICRGVLPPGTPERPRRPVAVIVALAAGVVLAACGSDDAAPEATNTTGRGSTVAVVGTDRLRFDPDGFTIAAGEEVNLELTAGSVEHDFVVEGAARYGTADADHGADNADDLHIAHAMRVRPSPKPS